jgi:hypothetical protein
MDQAVVRFSVVSTNHARLEAIRALYTPKPPIVDVIQHRVFILTRGSCGLSLSVLGEPGEPIVRENYDTVTLGRFDHALECLADPDPCGRLVMLHGPRGTGKTYLLQAFVHAMAKCLFVLVPPHMVSSLGDPEIVRVLGGQREMLGADAGVPFVLLIEDADQCVSVRMNDNLATVSTLLNTTDGLLGKELDLRVIVTTNADKIEFDPALIRDGRLCTDMPLEPLGAEHATSVLRRLLGPEAEVEALPGPLSLAQVYKLARRRGWKSPKSKSERRTGWPGGGACPGTGMARRPPGFVMPLGTGRIPGMGIVSAR